MAAGNAKVAKIAKKITTETRRHRERPDAENAEFAEHAEPLPLKTRRTPPRRGVVAFACFAVFAFALRAPRSVCLRVSVSPCLSG